MELLKNRTMYGSKKAQRSFTISDMGSIVITLVIFAVILSMGATILDKNKDLQTVNGSAFNTTNFGLDGINTMAQFLPTIAIVFVVVIVLGILIFFFRPKGF